MPIPVTCSGCDRSMKVKDDFAGKKARCPYCQSVVVVPGLVEEYEPEVESYDVEEVPAEREQPRRSSRRRDDPDDEPRPRRRDREENRFAEEPRSRRRDDDREEDRPSRRYDEDDEDRPVRRKKKKKQPSPSGGNLGSILGGLGMMVLAVIWFVVGLSFGWIAFYPPVLFIIGIIAVVKGITGQE